MVVDVRRFEVVKGRSAAVIEKVRKSALSPQNCKRAPSFTSAEFLSVLDKDPVWLERCIRRGDEPMPQRSGKGALRAFDLQSMRAWARRERSQYQRPQGQLAKAICVANFKGGSSKTTTAGTLAQGLSIRGHRVLAIDADPQASLSLLFGVLPEVDNPATLLDVCTGEKASVRDLIRPTYWDGVDLIAASNFLSHADSHLPLLDGYWGRIEQALLDVRDEYDVIVFDTSPTLSPLSSACVMASDGLLVPLVPSNLDFASSVQFFGMLGSLLKTFEKVDGRAKNFDFASVFLTRVDTADRENVAVVRQMAKAAYTDMLLSVEIPKTTAFTRAGLQFGTIYDTQRFSTSKSAHMRAKLPFDSLVNEVETQLCLAWAGKS